MLSKEKPDDGKTKGVERNIKYFCFQTSGKLHALNEACTVWEESTNSLVSTSTNMPLGAVIHNIETKPGRGGRLVRAAGTVAKIIAKEGRLVTLRLPSGEIRLLSQKCLATVGQIGSIDANNVRMGKAGSKRWLGKRPRVRGVVMNPIDHPHGGGEGKVPIGRKKPLTPWGHPALGKKSRKRNKYSDTSILRRRTV